MYPLLVSSSGGIPALLSLAALAAGAPAATSGVYRNPLAMTIPAGGAVESCADPAIIRGQTAGDTDWYLYCTSDPLNDADRVAGAGPHLVPMLRSHDLVHWTYEGDAFAARPPWVAESAGLWAPHVAFFDGAYHLYFAASDTTYPGGGSAIGVATAPAPLGPWTDSGAAVVEPHDAPCCPGSRRWVFDPFVIEDAGQRFIYYGSYFGGISRRPLSADGLHSDPAQQLQITIDNRYEAPALVQHAGAWYLFASAADCCRGPLSGYSTFVARSTSSAGPFVDRDGASVLDGRVGGTPCLSLNGNRWVGPGHGAPFQDVEGRWWMVYHAVDGGDPYFEGDVGFTRRPALLDALDWVDGWPTVRGGLWASDSPQKAPAAQPGDRSSYVVRLPAPELPGRQIASASDELDGDALAPRWSWVRPPLPGTWAVSGGVLTLETQAAELYLDSNSASVLVEAAPAGDFLVDTRVQLDVPEDGCCQNYVQVGLVLYGDDDRYVKLAVVSIWDTRQTELAKEVATAPPGYPRYGNTVVGAPGDWTYLRIVRRATKDGELYTGYTSPDGVSWTRGGAWTHALGSGARIGLVSMGGSGFTATFDYVRAYTLRSGPR